VDRALFAPETGMALAFILFVPSRILRQVS